MQPELTREHKTQPKARNPLSFFFIYYLILEDTFHCVADCRIGLNSAKSVIDSKKRLERLGEFAAS